MYLWNVYDMILYGPNYIIYTYQIISAYLECVWYVIYGICDNIIYV